MDIIEIDKTLIPYKFKIKFSNGTFQFGIRYNDYSDRILVDLYNENGELIHDNEELVYGIPLFKSVMEDVNGNLNNDYPIKYIQPLSTDGSEVVCNLANLGETYFLAVRPRG